MKTHIDFETYSELDIRKTGAHRYAYHPSTEIICMSWGTGSTSGRWLPGDAIPAFFFDDIEIHAWNVFFEACILEAKAADYGFPDVARNRYRDTMALSSYFGLPLDLYRASRIVDPNQAKDTRGKRLINLLCKPHKPTKARPWDRLTPENAPDLFEEMYQYCDQDVVAERAVHDFLPRQELPELEHDIWYQNFLASMRGVQCDMKLVHRMIELRTEHITKSVDRFRQITGGYAPTQVAKVQDWLSVMHGIQLENMQAQTLRDLLEEDVHPEVQEVIEIRQSVSKTSVKKLDAMVNCSSPDGKVHGMMVYYGAHTGRNAGRLVQLLNLPRGDFKAHEILHKLIREGLDLDCLTMLMGEPMNALSTLIRGCMTASKGRHLYLADYSSIEARVVAWIAGQLDMLEMFFMGVDPYIAAAADIYQVPESEVTKDQRALGKVQVLGCGYQMGKDRFFDTCGEWGVKVERELSDRAVDLFRSKNDRIVQYWWDADNRVKAAIKAPNTIIEIGPVKVASNGRFLFVRLPSGRAMTYPMPRVESKKKNFPQTIVERHVVQNDDGTETVVEKEVTKNHWRWVEVITYMGIDSQTRQWKRHESYGGKLTENWTQAIARDVMAEAQLRTQEEGFDYLFSVYDEIVSEADSPDRLEEYIDLMTQVPEWAEGLPVAAEGEVCHRFKK